MFLGLDLGTGSTKAIVLDEGVEVRGEGSAPYRVDAPPPDGQSRTRRIGGPRRRTPPGLRSVREAER